MDPSHYEVTSVLSGADPAEILRGVIAAKCNRSLPPDDPCSALSPDDIRLDPRLLSESLFSLYTATGRTQVVILDQAEELFTLNPSTSPRIQDLFETLTMLVEEQSIKIKIVLSFRTEFRGEFFPLEQRLNRFARPVIVQEISEHGLNEAIRRPSELDVYGFRYEKDVVRRIAADVLTTTRKRGETALSCMQIVCSQL